MSHLNIGEGVEGLTGLNLGRFDVNGLRVRAGRLLLSGERLFVLLEDARRTNGLRLGSGYGRPGGRRRRGGRVLRRVAEAAARAAVGRRRRRRGHGTAHVRRFEALHFVADAHVRHVSFVVHPQTLLVVVGRTFSIGRRRR